MRAARPESELDLAEWGADAILRSYELFREEFNRITGRARARFEARDWRGIQQDAVERLDLRPRSVQELVQALEARCAGAAERHALFAGMKRLYAARMAGRHDVELAETFFNSATRRVLGTVGVQPDQEFVASDWELLAAPSAEPVYATYRPEGGTEALFRRLLGDRAFRVPWRDLAGDARLAAAELDAFLASTLDGRPLDAVELARPVFFRNKGAYLVGRLRRGDALSPLLLPLLNGEGGIALDAVLLTERDASIVFSFTRSYFHVEIDRPHDLVWFVKSLLPTKRVSEIYIGLGYNKHGKTELYRELQEHLAHGHDRFRVAAGVPGMVMAVFTLPSLDLVFKVIKDRFPAPKSTTRAEVMRKYALVFRHDRAGRLVDAQEFEHLAFERARFEPALLEALLRDCGESVRLEGDRVVVRHLYAERRLVPLDLYVRDHDEPGARDAVLDYGQCIRDLAATNTFPGDLLLKNFGVTRHGRVIFYDYDELCPVTECRFRDLPAPRDDGEETAAEPWFYVADEDVFPEEFLRFLGLPGPLREAFLSAHAELLTAGFWRRCQERLRAGEVIDIFPYRQSQRLGHSG
ncbi:bifunctional isocitrate dehydrogenase kinase/phosphatase [Anaeromyxobacter paludicola]|uniref:Isocitrate dehydrogenase kinase/phosphatase n=1 Tax=Anaeromyxobacter paludicola TaxID=2918171 RepID=A0ABN6N6E7_9BACT|nr:bifunctional isocitrate dehydrogenase kinase/phosphatase [Anaeromyxobacter paludicola]BDG08754.1 isocitrate dehydrogenase kinase/phosphatase [Anaeromyxobacter paludicola]